MFYSVQQDEVYCKVRAVPDRLKMEADRIDYNMPLDSACMKAICDRGRFETHGWNPIAYTTFANEMEPYEGHYAAYDKERASADDIPYKTYPEGTFRNIDRIKLILSIMEAPTRVVGSVRRAAFGRVCNRVASSADTHLKPCPDVLQLAYV